MEIRSFGPSSAHPIDAYGSAGLSARALVRGDALAVTVLHVAAGGEIGRHPAPVDQLFMVVTGSGSVQGGDGGWQPIAAGQAAVWRAGEQHCTRAAEALTAVVLEMPEIPLR